MVEILAPFHGRILDPACGSGGMFVQSAHFIAERKKIPSSELSIFGVEETDETGRLARINLAVHELEWQPPEKIRIQMGAEMTHRTRKALLDAVRSHAVEILDRRIESDKEADPFLHGMPGAPVGVKPALRCRMELNE